MPVMETIISTAFIGVMAFHLMIVPVYATVTEKKPNIVFILMDVMNIYLSSYCTCTDLVIILYFAGCWVERRQLQLRPNSDPYS